MAERYFLEMPVEGGKAVLSGDEAHHLIHVMRAKVGTPVILFDGRGTEYPAQVEQLGRSEVRLAVASPQRIDRELGTEITVAVSLPKGDRQKWLIEKSVELGVAKVVPLKTTRSVAQPVEQALHRLRRTVIEASKQCGRNRLMEIGEPAEWIDLVQQTPARSVRLVAHPARPSPTRDDHPHLPSVARHSPVIVAVGPEGGFTEEEVQLAVHGGWQTIDLGPRILRIETAALFLVALIQGWEMRDGR